MARRRASRAPGRHYESSRNKRILRRHCITTNHVHCTTRRVTWPRTARGSLSLHEKEMLGEVHEILVGSDDRTNRSSRLMAPELPPMLVTEVNAVGRSLRCPGFGSSSSSTSPNSLGSILKGSPLCSVPLRFKGDGGGLRERERLASSCRNEIGEKSGVLGTEVGKRPARVAAMPIVSFGCDGRGGKEFHVDVT
jgi:hypothetical protein